MELDQKALDAAVREYAGYRWRSMGRFAQASATARITTAIRAYLAALPSDPVRDAAPELLAALKEAADQFQIYADLHTAKGADDKAAHDRP